MVRTDNESPYLADSGVWHPRSVCHDQGYRVNRHNRPSPNADREPIDPFH
jgi:hypothetical protein